MLIFSLLPLAVVCKKYAIFVNKEVREICTLVGKNVSWSEALGLLVSVICSPHHDGSAQRSFGKHFIFSVCTMVWLSSSYCLLRASVPLCLMMCMFVCTIWQDKSLGVLERSVYSARYVFVENLHRRWGEFLRFTVKEEIFIGENFCTFPFLLCILCDDRPTGSWNTTCKRNKLVLSLTVLFRSKPFEWKLISYSWND